MWKQIRILMLLCLLLVLSINSCRDQIQDWTQPIIVRLHFINADASPHTQAYIDRLSVKDFADAAEYMRQNSAVYRNQPIAIYFEIGQPLHEKPPVIPEQSGVVQAIWWSLKFRWYAWQRQDAGSATMTLFLNYYDPEQHPRLKHSTALQKGRIGVVNLFASPKQANENQIVLVHELLHGFGATDKYDLSTGQPLYPQGYAEPALKPLYPQRYAEIMAIQRPISESQSKMSRHLDENVLSPLTAREIGWLR